MVHFIKILVLLQLGCVNFAIVTGNVTTSDIKVGNGPKLVIKPKQSVDRSGNLILTPLIASGQIKEARRQARVRDLEGTSGIRSYTGFFTVNPLYNSNMFFWFFPAQMKPDTAPLLIWLQGGPGSTSLFGLFAENGPFFIDKMLNLKIRKDYAWTLTHSMVYFDNPVGTGFSYTDADEGYARSMKDVTRDLYSALTQFYQLFPKYSPRDLYITGESYGGRYCPEFAYKIHTENMNPSRSRINLKGVIVGNGLFDPYNSLHYDEVFYNFGLLDENERRYFFSREEIIRVFMRGGRWADAANEFDTFLLGDRTPYPTYFTNVTGFTNYFNLLVASNTSQPELHYYEQFVQQANIRRAIHVGNQNFEFGSTKVQVMLINEFLKSSSPRIEKLLDAPERYQITFYTGQLDLIVPETSVRHMVENLEWSGKWKYLKEQKLIWRSEDGTEILGYVKTVKNLNVLLIRNAGHFVPFDQPAVGFRMINSLTSGKVFK